MKSRFQFASWLIALGLSTGLLLAWPALAQKPRGGGQNRPPQSHPQNRPERSSQNRPSQNQRQQNQQERQQRQSAVPPQRNANRPPQSDIERSNAARNPNRPPSAYTPPPARNFSNLTPQEKQRTLNNYRDFERRTPLQRQQMQDGQRNWQRLTPEQKSHVKDDLLPKWRQLPPDRQRAISSRLNVLKNMPESARNQHLDDPNFTRGMSDQDKSMLRDLSHLHVGGAPEPSPE